MAPDDVEPKKVEIGDEKAKLLILLRLDLVTKGSRKVWWVLRGKKTNAPHNPLQSSRDPGSPNQF
jgi:hypothetical protein